MPGVPVGYCGYYCARCPIYVACTTSDVKMQEKLARKFSREAGEKLAAEDVHCWGCRAGNRHCWGKDCEIRKCAGEKGIDFCYQCREFPCVALSRTYDKYPEARENLSRICKIGVEAFVSEMSART